jgi:hypothetical protein
LEDNDTFESKTTLFQEGKDDEDITIIDTTTPVTSSQMTRAHAHKLNYQMNSFLAVEANSSLNEVIKHVDNFIMLTCLGVEPS